jgi:hypothetical protein
MSQCPEAGGVKRPVLLPQPVVLAPFPLSG